MLASEKMDITCSTIKAVSGLAEPFNFRFDGGVDDTSLFTRIIRGELQQWRVWEDDSHVAFLTPYANTPGLTVLVPRRHLSSDIFSIKDELYCKLMAAAHTVGTILKGSFGISRCGMIFEGLEIDYAHVKLVPVQQEYSNIGEFWEKQPAMDIESYQESYKGYVSSLDGPLFKDVCSLASAALDISKRFSSNIVSPPQS